MDMDIKLIIVNSKYIFLNITISKYYIIIDIIILYNKLYSLISNKIMYR